MIEPKINIGIPASNWNHLIEESLSYCLKLKYSNFKIVVVLNKKTRIPNEYLKNKKIVFRFLNKNIAAKRNLAIKTHKADYYACLDSDSYPQSDWLKNALLTFKKDAEIIAVGGPNLSPQYSDSKKSAVANALRSYLVGGPRVFVKRISKSRLTDDLPTCNFIMHKELIEQIGFFNESLMTGEDTELCQRIIKAGRKIYFDKKVVVYHHNRSLLLPFLKQKIVFGYAVIPLLKQNLTFKKFFIIPLLEIIFIFFGWLSYWINKQVFYFWISGSLLFFLLVFLETRRQTKREYFLTFLAILIGNLGPGLGLLWALIGGKINFNKFYINY